MATSSKAVGSAGLREWMNQNSSLVTIAAIAILVIAIGAIFWNNRDDRGVGPIDEVWFYVPETKEMFAADSKLLPPIDRNGKKAVKAHVYGCGDCSEANRFTGYYETYTDQGKAKMEQIMAQMGQDPEKDAELESVSYDISMSERKLSGDGVKWVPAESEEANMIQEKMREKCGTAKLVFCHPGA